MAVTSTRRCRDSRVRSSSSPTARAWCSTILVPSARSTSMQPAPLLELGLGPDAAEASYRRTPRCVARRTPRPDQAGAARSEAGRRTRQHLRGRVAMAGADRSSLPARDVTLSQCASSSRYHEGDRTSDRVALHCDDRVSSTSTIAKGDHVAVAARRSSASCRPAVDVLLPEVPGGPNRRPVSRCLEQCSLDVAGFRNRQYFRMISGCPRSSRSTMRRPLSAAASSSISRKSGLVR